MSHDQMCPGARRVDPNYDTLWRCQCDLIAAVRSRTLDEAVAAVERVPWSATFTDLWVADRRDVLDAITALRQVSP